MDVEILSGMRSSLSESWRTAQFSAFPHGTGKCGAHGNKGGVENSCRRSRKRAQDAKADSVEAPKSIWRERPRRIKWKAGWPGSRKVVQVCTRNELCRRRSTWPVAHDAPDPAGGLPLLGRGQGIRTTVTCDLSPSPGQAGWYVGGGLSNCVSAFMSALLAPATDA